MRKIQVVIPETGAWKSFGKLSDAIKYRDWVNVLHLQPTYSGKPHSKQTAYIQK